MIRMASAARRRLVLLLGLLPLLVRHAQGQATAKPIRIGVLLSGTEREWSRYDAAVVAGLREHGYVEGQNLTVVRRYGNLDGNRIKRFAAELNALQLDAIVTSCTSTTRAAQLAAPDTPIVMGVVADPVGQGLVNSLARPGVNVTGRASQSTELLPKRLELLRALLPERATVAVLMNSANPLHETQWTAVVAAAGSMNVAPVRVAAQGAAGMDAAFAALSDVKAHGVVVLADDPTMIEFQPRILAAVERLRLPAIYAYPEVAVAGGLMSYGTDMVHNFRRSAAHVVKVAKGANAAELPVEQSLHQEFVLNVRTAKALGLTLPPTLLARADRVIE
jgi:putative ABC transport system substrate-binding protein